MVHALSGHNVKENECESHKACGIVEAIHAGRTVSRMLRAMGYSMRANRKTAEGRQHPDRDAQ